MKLEEIMNLPSQTQPGQKEEEEEEEDKNLLKQTTKENLIDF